MVLAQRILLVALFGYLALMLLVTAVAERSPLVGVAAVSCAVAAWTGQRAAQEFFADVSPSDRTAFTANVRTAFLWSLATLALLAAAFGLPALAGSA